MNWRALRIEAGLTQVELARRVGCTASYISRIEIGTGKLTVEMEARILSGLRGECVPGVIYAPPDIPFANEKQECDLKAMWRERGYGT